MIINDKNKTRFRNLSLLLSSICFLITSACAIAPLTEEHTAKSLGKGNNEWSAQYGAGTSIAYKRGLSEKFDLGIIFEYQSLTAGLLYALTGKYQLTNGVRPLSLIGNVGVGTGTTFGSLGLIYDFVHQKKYILSFNVRYNVFNWDIDFETEDSEDGETAENAEEASEFINDVIEGGVESLNGTYSYASINIANTYRFTPVFSATLNLGGYIFLESGAQVQPNFGLKLNFNY